MTIFCGFISFDMSSWIKTESILRIAPLINLGKNATLNRDLPIKNNSYKHSFINKSFKESFPFWILGLLASFSFLVTDNFTQSVGILGAVFISINIFFTRSLRITKGIIYQTYFKLFYNIIFPLLSIFLIFIGFNNFVLELSYIISAFLLTIMLVPQLSSYIDIRFSSCKFAVDSSSIRSILHVLDDYIYIILPYIFYSLIIDEQSVSNLSFAFYLCIFCFSFLAQTIFDLNIVKFGVAISKFDKINFLVLLKNYYITLLFIYILGIIGILFSIFLVTGNYFNSGGFLFEMIFFCIFSSSFSLIRYFIKRDSSSCFAMLMIDIPPLLLIILSPNDFLVYTFYIIIIYFFIMYMYMYKNFLNANFKLNLSK